jgi:hypothetical protein
LTSTVDGSTTTTSLMGATMAACGLALSALVRSMFFFTTVASKADPSWKTTSVRSLNRQVFGSGRSQLVASQGCGSPLASCMVSESYMG